ncbi:EamA family transporter [Shewanella intestini]|uniref:EamA family transporter n=1 Tax=Shewanella intestini TaxID=2017544 RepID=A0ABS5I4J1_9GAMM|nr:MULTISPECIES: EamA family transporter [Shewanella]MBR9728826.1 EamA family transporter [Shewanella intestini]MRG37108.1 EamA family transporter [Shewanella sp. XMDDZSB0408]
MTLILFCLSVIASSLSQYWQKRASAFLEAQPTLSLSQKLFNKPIILSILFLGLGALTWLAVLTDWEVSTAYPLLSINFIVMLVMSKYCFNEVIALKQWLGVAFIMVGVALLSGGIAW